MQEQSKQSNQNLSSSKMFGDYLVPRHMATWNTAIGVWQTNQQNLLCEHLELFSETWPTSGMTQNGLAFELPTQVQHTTASESSLLRSPKASEGQGGALGESVAKERGNMVGLRDQIKDLVYLPTPNTMEHREIKTPEQIAELKQRSPGGYRNLREEVIHHLPTPMTTDYKQTDCAGNWNRHSPPLGTIVHGPWGKFEPAIRRWEQVIGRLAPAPTNPDGKDGNHRLSSKFTEWLMGLPDGWITDVGLTRNEELKACGNGVVPQQAELALTQLLKGIKL